MTDNAKIVTRRIELLHDTNMDIKSEAVQRSREEAKEVFTAEVMVEMIEESLKLRTSVRAHKEPKVKILGKEYKLVPVVK